MKNVLCPSWSVAFFVTITYQRKMGHKVHEGCTKYTKITAGFSYKIFFKKRFILSVHCGSLCTSCPSFNGFKDGLIVNFDTILLKDGITRVLNGFQSFANGHQGYVRRTKARLIG